MSLDKLRCKSRSIKNDFQNLAIRSRHKPMIGLDFVSHNTIVPGHIACKCLLLWDWRFLCQKKDSLTCNSKQSKEIFLDLLIKKGFVDLQLEAIKRNISWSINYLSMYDKKKTITNFAAPSHANPDIALEGATRIHEMKGWSFIILNEPGAWKNTAQDRTKLTRKVKR